MCFLVGRRTVGIVWVDTGLGRLDGEGILVVIFVLYTMERSLTSVLIAVKLLPISIACYIYSLQSYNQIINRGTEVVGYHPRRLLVMYTLEDTTSVLKEPPRTLLAGSYQGPQPAIELRV